MNTREFTTIGIRHSTYERLAGRKAAPRDSFEHVLNVLLDKIEAVEKGGRV